MPSHRSLLALLTALVVIALPTGARASCAGPAVQVAASGSQVEVTGEAWLIGCQDVCVCTAGCLGDRCDCGPPPRPVVGVTIEVLDRAGTVLGTGGARPDGDGRFRMPVAVPADATPASVRVVGEGLEVLERIGPPAR